MRATIIMAFLEHFPHPVKRRPLSCGLGLGAGLAYTRPQGRETHIMSHPELLRLRDSIDNIDAALIHLLAERFKCTQAVGEFKAAHALPPADPSREAAQIARLRKLAEEAKLDPDFAETFLNFIVREVIRHHEAIAKNKGA
jgi:chorismate mutase